MNACIQIFEKSFGCIYVVIGLTAVFSYRKVCVKNEMHLTHTFVLKYADEGLVLHSVSA